MWSFVRFYYLTTRYPLSRLRIITPLSVVFGLQITTNVGCDYLNALNGYRTFPQPDNLDFEIADVSLNQQSYNL